jgi:pseudaminic acid cytidylyltransferase
MQIAIIPARGGSSRIRGKNKRPFMGRPIVEYSIEAAMTSQLFDEVIVSSDSQEILAIAERMKVRGFERDPYYARDEVGTQEVAKYVIEQADAAFDARGPITRACVIYPTAPLMYLQDLIDAHAWLEEMDADFVMSVAANPLADAAQFYWGKAEAFRTQVPLIAQWTIMYPIDQGRVCDINTEEDWNLAERKYKALYPMQRVGY